MSFTHNTDYTERKIAQYQRQEGLGVEKKRNGIERGRETSAVEKAEQKNGREEVGSRIYVALFGLNNW